MRSKLDVISSAFSPFSLWPSIYTNCFPGTKIRLLQFGSFLHSLQRSKLFSLGFQCCFIAEWPSIIELICSALIPLIWCSLPGVEKDQGDDLFGQSPTVASRGWGLTDWPNPWLIRSAFPKTSHLPVGQNLSPQSFLLLKVQIRCCEGRRFSEYFSLAW